jgi:hypothetical protein
MRKSGRPDFRCIHVLAASKTWMAGTSPAMTIESYEYLARKMAAYNIPSTRGSQSDSSGI